MDEEIETLMIGVRADTRVFERDVATLINCMPPFEQKAEVMGRTLDNALSRAIRNGKFGLEDLKKAVLAVMADIAVAAVRNGIGAALGGESKTLGGLLGSVLGVPGRATGGPVAPGNAYWVGERGPELFVPTTSGRIEAGGASGGRDVRVAISINAGGSDAPRALAKSGRQVARAVRQALDAAER